MAQYMLLLRDNPAEFAGYSAGEMQRIIEKYRTWRTSLGARIEIGKKLKDGEGRVLRKQAVTDGPYTESKEVMGGFFVVDAASYDEALELASTCPHVEFGSIEVREVEIT